MSGRVLLIAAVGALALAAVATSARPTRLSTRRRPWSRSDGARGQMGRTYERSEGRREETVVYVAGDMRNGGILGVAHGLKDAADVIGWTYREIDGQGTDQGRLRLEPSGGVSRTPSWSAAATPSNRRRASKTRPSRES